MTHEREYSELFRYSPDCFEYATSFREQARTAIQDNPQKFEELVKSTAVVISIAVIHDATECNHKAESTIDKALEFMPKDQDGKTQPIADKLLRLLPLFAYTTSNELARFYTTDKIQKYQARMCLFLIKAVEHNFKGDLVDDNTIENWEKLYEDLVRFLENPYPWSGC